MPAFENPWKPERHTFADTGKPLKKFDLGAALKGLKAIVGAKGTPAKKVTGIKKVSKRRANRVERARRGPIPKSEVRKRAAQYAAASPAEKVQLRTKFLRENEIRKAQKAQEKLSALGVDIPIDWLLRRKVVHGPTADVPTPLKELDTRHLDQLATDIVEGRLKTDSRPRTHEERADAARRGWRTRKGRRVGKQVLTPSSTAAPVAKWSPTRSVRETGTGYRKES